MWVSGRAASRPGMSGTAACEPSPIAALAFFVAERRGTPLLPHLWFSFRALNREQGRRT